MPIPTAPFAADGARAHVVKPCPIPRRHSLCLILPPFSSRCFTAVTGALGRRPSLPAFAIALPAMAIVFWHVVHEDVSTGSPCPEAGHVDHGTDDKVVPGERTEEGVQLHGSGRGGLSQASVSHRQALPSKSIPQKSPCPALQGCFPVATLVDVWLWFMAGCSLKGGHGDGFPTSSKRSLLV